MPNTKKIPATNARKRVTASARARINTGRTKRSSDNNGSYIQDMAKETVSTVPSLSSTGPDSGPTSTQTSNDAILAYLKRIDDSTKALGERVQAIERNHSIEVTPVRQRLHSHDGDPPNAFGLPAASTGRQNRHSLRFRDPASEGLHSSNTNHQFHVPENMSQPLTSQVGDIPQSSRDPHRDSIIPGVDVLRRNPTVSQAVSSVLASYDAQIQNQVLQGKQASKRSGRYNTTDTTTALPEYRWPNEGYHGSKGKKRVLYDDLSLSQWAVGQLTNVHQIQDPTILRQALLQVILALRDATSLPWQAVRDAWSHSMHDIEEGRLTWADSTQWAINRLSASQIAMANSQITNQGQFQGQKKVCRYYNEDKCSHEGNHGQFRHNCAFCARQGRNNTHPETKCLFKQKGQDKANSK